MQQRTASIAAWSTAVASMAMLGVAVWIARADQSSLAGFGLFGILVVTSSSVLGALIAAYRPSNPIAATVESDGIGRYAPEVEATFYFCALEALQNVAKYAEATRVAVRLNGEDGHVVFRIDDDGRGFDTASAGFGTGLQGMADRLDAIGGALHVSSAVGSGTTITGRGPTGVRR